MGMQRHSLIPQKNLSNSETLKSPLSWQSNSLEEEKKKKKSLLSLLNIKQIHMPDAFLPCSVCGHPALQSTCNTFGHRKSIALKVTDTKNTREPPQECIISALEISAAVLSASVPHAEADCSEPKVPEPQSSFQLCASGFLPLTVRACGAPAAPGVAPATADQVPTLSSHLPWDGGRTKQGLCHCCRWGPVVRTVTEGSNTDKAFTKEASRQKKVV